MKKLLLTSLFLSGFTAFTSFNTALAEEVSPKNSNFFTDISAAPWEAIHHADAKTRIIDACAARVDAPPYRVVFGGSKTGLEMWIANDAWKIPKSFAEPATLKMKDFTFKGMTYYYADNRIYLHLSEAQMKAILHAIENGHMAAIHIEEKAAFPIPLDHSRKVLKSFRRCVTSMAFADLRKDSQKH